MAFVSWLNKLRDALHLPDPYSPANFGSPEIKIKTGDAVVQIAHQGAGPVVGVKTMRYVKAADSYDRPASGVRVLTPYLEERWTAVPQSLDGATEMEILAAAAGGVPIAGYKVTTHARAAHCDCAQRSFERTQVGYVHPACGRPMQSRVEGEIREHVLGLSLQANDQFDGYYATIKGTDAYDDRVTTGGTRITGGRAEYKRVLKQRGYEAWDAGWQRDTERIAAEKQGRRDAAFALVQERADKSLPRKLGEV